MIKFTDKRLYLKGTAAAYVYDKATDDLIYYSPKFQTGNITPSTNLGEIRAGLGNPIVATIPTDASLTVDFTAADFNLGIKAAQVGGALSYGAPVMMCQTVTATGASLTADVSKGTPVAPLGSDGIVAYVVEVGEAAPIATYGTAYPIDPSTGAISGFASTSGHTYKVFYNAVQANAQSATIFSVIDPKVVRFEAIMAVYANDGSAANEGTKVGNLHVIVPSLKFGGNGGVNGDQSANDSTSLSGTAIAYDETVISDACEGCGADGSALAYYIYEPCDSTEGIQGLVFIGGAISLVKSTSKKAQFYIAMADGSLAVPDEANMAYSMTTAITGTTVSATGVISAGSTAGDGELTATYTDGATSFTCVANVSVTNS